MRKLRFTVAGWESDAFETREKAEAFKAQWPSLATGEIVELPEGPRVVELDGDTGEAYDATQCYESIADGDVIVVPEEQVVGILWAAWPTAVTVRQGHFHDFEANWSWKDEVVKEPRYAASLELANREILKRGWR